MQFIWVIIESWQNWSPNFYLCQILIQFRIFNFPLPVFRTSGDADEEPLGQVEGHDGHVGDHEEGGGPPESEPLDQKSGNERSGERAEKEGRGEHACRHLKKIVPWRFTEVKTLRMKIHQLFLVAEAKPSQDQSKNSRYCSQLQWPIL